MSALKRNCLTAFLMMLTLMACGPSNSRMQAFKYHENAKKRPIVAMLPVFNRVNDYLPWDLSEEFTSEIQKRLMYRSVIYLNSVDIPTHLRAKLESEDMVNLTKEDFAELTNENDFVVMLELLEHSETPVSKEHMDASIAADAVDRNLNMKMRVQVLDLRGEKLRTVLQEIRSLEHLIPRNYTHIDYDKVVWGSDAYPATAYGRAHARLEKELSKQIENYISIAH